MTKKRTYKNPWLAMARAEDRINIEEDFVMNEYWEQQGLNRRFPRKFMEENFWYNTLATTEQRAAVDSVTNIEVTRAPEGSGLILGERRTVSYDFLDDLDKYVGGIGDFQGE